MTLAMMLGLGWSACQRNEPPQSSPQETAEQASSAQATAHLDAYGRDVDNLCHSEERSGALERPEAERVMIVAQWLGDTLQTDKGRSFLAKMSQASPAEKVSILDSEAARLGLEDCPLARTWGAGLKK